MDATVSKTCYGYGRYVNHSRTNANMNAKVIQSVEETDYERAEEEEYLCFIAKRDIEEGEELLFDYGERRREVCNHFQWLRH